MTEEEGVSGKVQREEEADCEEAEEYDALMNDLIRGIGGLF